jgi:hypothetical protein
VKDFGTQPEQDSISAQASLARIGTDNVLQFTAIPSIEL